MKLRSIKSNIRPLMIGVQHITGDHSVAEALAK